VEVTINVWARLRTVGSSDKRLGVVKDDWNGQIGNVWMDVQAWLRMVGSSDKRLGVVKDGWKFR
jgi:hypothetical protein